jgi:hypothetical protein
MSFLYPRTVSITRPGAQPIDQVGFQASAPSGDPAEETSIATGLRANIELRGKQGANPVGLPGDVSQDEWDIRIPKSAAARGLIEPGYFVTDDLGERYKVSANYWNSLGYALRATKMKA